MSYRHNFLVFPSFRAEFIFSVASVVSTFFVLSLAVFPPRKDKTEQTATIPHTCSVLKGLFSQKQLINHSCSVTE